MAIIRLILYLLAIGILIQQVLQGNYLVLTAGILYIISSFKGGNNGK